MKVTWKGASFQRMFQLILVTRLDNSPMLLNIDNVKYIESTPDTIIRFMNGDSLIIRENIEQIRDLSRNHAQMEQGLKAPPQTEE